MMVRVTAAESHAAPGPAAPGASGCPPPRPGISIVVPALNEERALPRLLATVRAQMDAPPHEIVLADGGSTDRTIEIFQAAPDADAAPAPRRLVVRSRGRGRSLQMNEGAAASSGAILLFVHADTLLPARALAAVAKAMLDPGVVGGGFRLRFVEPGGLLRIIAAWATLRSRLTGLHYGDQAMFARRDLFERLGGFPEVALFEDLLLARALRRNGRVTTLPLAVETSARRLAAGGVARTALRFGSLKIRRALGADPDRLARDYTDVR